MVTNFSCIKPFDIPTFYRSSITGRIKAFRKIKDLRKQGFEPTCIDFGPVQFIIPRHFGFCYGVENAIEISYRALAENPGKNIYLLSQMIHNPIVNDDLQKRGIQFIMEADGSQLIPWSTLETEDIVIIPAFGITLETEKILLQKGIDVQKYNTTCPFVKKVWNRAEKLGTEDYTVIIHGKATHEETRATFSHSSNKGHSIIVRDMNDAIALSTYILENKSPAEFYDFFSGRISAGFQPNHHLKKVGVVNQTTMLASETKAISDFIQQVMITKYGALSIKDHFADTRDTLCYATNDNQSSTFQLLDTAADLAIVVGGYNSSNTSHIVELCETHFPTYFIHSAEKIKDEKTIQHFNHHTKQVQTSHGFLPDKNPLKIILTSGASCPDTLVDEVLLKVLRFFKNTKTVEEVMQEW